MFSVILASFDNFKSLALPFLSVFIPLLIAYKISRKTNFMVFILTIALYTALVLKFADDLIGINEPLGGLLVEGAEDFLSPCYFIVCGVLDFVGMADNALLIIAALWAIFLVLGIVGAMFGPIKTINTAINSLLGVAIIVLLIIYATNPESFNLIS